MEIILCGVVAVSGQERERDWVGLGSQSIAKNRTAQGRLFGGAALIQRRNEITSAYTNT